MTKSFIWLKVIFTVSNENITYCYEMYLYTHNYNVESRYLGSNIKCIIVLHIDGLNILAGGAQADLVVRILKDTFKVEYRIDFLR